MGNITQLKQGSLSGLRRQTNECLDNAYRRGYDDGRIAEYQRGLEDGNKIAEKDLKELQDSTYDIAYIKGLQHGYEGYRYLQKWFITTPLHGDDEHILFPEYKRREANTPCLEDIIADVGFAKVLKRAKAYDEQKKAEKEIKVGDEVCTEHVTKTLIVTNIRDDGYFDGMDFDGLVYRGRNSRSWHKTGRHFDEIGTHFEEISQLLDKLRGSENEENN